MSTNLQQSRSKLFFQADDIVSNENIQRLLDIFNSCKEQIKEILDQFYEREEFKNIDSIEYIVSDFLLDIWIGELKKQGLFEELINNYLKNVLDEDLENLKNKLKCKSNKELDIIFLIILKSIHEQYLKNKLNEEKIDNIILEKFQFLAKEIPEIQKIVTINLIPELQQLLKCIDPEKLKVPPLKNELEHLLSNIKLLIQNLLETHTQEINNTYNKIKQLYEKIKSNNLSEEEKKRIIPKIQILNKKLEILKKFEENKVLFLSILDLITKTKEELSKVKENSPHELIQFYLFETALLEIVETHKNELYELFHEVEQAIKLETLNAKSDYANNLLQLWYLLERLRAVLLSIQEELRKLVEFPDFDEIEKIVKKSLLEILSEVIYQSLKERGIDNPIKFKQEFPNTWQFINYISGVRGKFYNELPRILDKMGIKKDLQPLPHVKERKPQVIKDKKPKITVKSPKDIIFG